MARAFTLTQMTTRALQLADMETSGFIGSSEATDAINAGIAYVWGELIRVSPEQYSSDATLTTVAGTIAYSLPSDFLRAMAVYAVEASDGSRRPIEPVNTFNRAYFKAPTAVYSLVLDYIPTAVKLSSGSDTFDGVCGYEEIVCAHAARRFLQKEESDVSVVQGILAEWRASLGQNFRSTSGPRYVTDVDASDANIYPTAVGIRGWRLRGANTSPTIELYEPVLPFMVNA